MRELLPMVSERPVDESTGAPRPVPAAHAEIMADRRLYELARETIRQQPGMFACASLFRVAWLWTPLPHQVSVDESFGRTWARWCVAVWYVLIYLGVLVGMGVLGRRGGVPPWIWGLLAVLAFTLVHSVYWSNMRMRAPLMPVVYLVFALGCRRICAQVGCCKPFSRK